MAMAPFIGYWVVQSRRAERARQDFEAANAGFNIGAVTFEDVYDRSRKLRDADLGVPFSSRHTSRVAYLNRLAALERRLKAMLRFALPGGDNTIAESKKTLKALGAERGDLERELGTKAAD